MKNILDFNWKTLCEVGILLSNYSNKEQYERSAISRFYYACYNLSKDYYENTHHTLLSSFGLLSTHQILINKLEDSAYDEERELGGYLRILRDYRNNADYDKKFHNKNLHTSKKVSKEIIQLLDKLYNNPVVPKF